jgi:E3 ubiquitin-protein ligase HUWE1
MMNNDFNTEDLNLTFGFIDMKKYSDDLLVTNNNKPVFLELLLNYYGYQKSMNAINEFLKGLYSVIPAELLNLLSLKDLEKLLIGSKKIDLVDWRINTKYVNKTPSNTHIVDWFWEAIGSLKDEQLRKILQF